MTATEASRTFAAVLDEIERGETIIVTRGGRRIAKIEPTPASNGEQVIAFLTSHTADAEMAADIVAVREAMELDEPAWPAD